MNFHFFGLFFYQERPITKIELVLYSAWDSQWEVDGSFNKPHQSAQFMLGCWDHHRSVHFLYIFCKTFQQEQNSDKKSNGTHHSIKLGKRQGGWPAVTGQATCQPFLSNIAYIEVSYCIWQLFSRQSAKGQIKSEWICDIIDFPN